jgi:hypothetical protein
MIEETETLASSPPPSQQGIGETMRDAAAGAREHAGEMKESARSALEGATAVAADRTAEVRDQAVGEIERTARGLEAAADEMRGSPFQQDLLREAAEGLKQISHAIEGKSVGAVVAEISDFGRRNPLAYLGGAALAGFALARFARASARQESPSRWAGQESSRRFETPPETPEVRRTQAGQENPAQRPITEVPGGFTHG